MPKEGEIDYLKNIGPDAVRHALHKPFSDPECGRYFLDLGVIFTLLPPPPARVLDLGAGTGWTSAFLARRGYDVLGQDLAPDMIALAESRQVPPDSGPLNFLVCDYEDLPFDGAFDAALFYDALHHAEDERRALAGACRALKPGGVCITVEPGRGHAEAARAVAAKYNVTEKDMPPAHIIELGKAVGFRAFHVYARPSVHAEWSEPDPGRGTWQRLNRTARQLAKALVGPWRERHRLLEGSHIVLMRK